MYACAIKMESSNERLSYAPRKLHLVTGLQWVEQKEQDAKVFYSMFIMRRSVFTHCMNCRFRSTGLSQLATYHRKKHWHNFYGLWCMPNN
uniref:Uncharacterized protein n=1 Tax=Hordeum vulgare subsp. vulgare TaxID=112509 RepID=A0A8I6XVH9_HORVV